MLFRVKSRAKLQARVGNPFAVLPLPLSRVLSNVVTVFLVANQVDIRRLKSFKAIMDMFFSPPTQDITTWWQTVRGNEDKTFDLRLLLQKAPDVIAKGLNALAETQVRETNMQASVTSWLKEEKLIDLEVPDVPGCFASLPYIKVNMPLHFVTKFDEGTDGKPVAVTASPKPWQHFGMRHTAARHLARLLGRIEMPKISTTILKKVPNVGEWKKQDLPFGPFLSYMSGLELQFSGGENFRRQLDILWARVGEPYVLRVQHATPFHHNKLAGYTDKDTIARNAIIAQRLHPLLAIVADLYKGWTIRTKYGDMPVVFRIEENGLKADNKNAFIDDVNEYAKWLVLTYKPNITRSHLQKYGGNVHAASEKQPDNTIEEAIACSEWLSQSHDLPEYISKEIVADASTLGWSDLKASGKRTLRAEGADFALCDGRTIEDGDAAVLAGLRPVLSLANEAINAIGPDYKKSFNTVDTDEEVKYSVSICPGRYSLSAKELWWLHARMVTWGHMGEDRVLPWTDAQSSDDDEVKGWLAYAADFYGKGAYPTLPYIKPDMPSADLTAAVTIEKVPGKQDITHGTMRWTSTGPEFLATTDKSLRWMKTQLATLAHGTNRLSYLESAETGLNATFFMRIPVATAPARYALFSEDGQCMHNTWLKRAGGYLLGEVEGATPPPLGDTAPTSAISIRDVLPDETIVDKFEGIELE